MAPSFFDDYRNFTQNPRAPITREFHRLACSMAWRGRAYKSLRAECYSQELVQHWGAIMSDDEDDDDEGSHSELSRLECWQMLCEELGVEDIPCSINKCQKVRSFVFDSISLLLFSSFLQHLFTVLYLLVLLETSTSGTPVTHTNTRLTQPRPQSRSSQNSRKHHRPDRRPPRGI